MFNLFKSSIIVVFSICSSGSLYANDAFYRVEGVTGRVEVMRPLDFQWRSLAVGESVQEESLVKLQKYSQFVFRNKKKLLYSIRTDQLTVFRLDRDFRRKIELENLSIDIGGWKPRNTARKNKVSRVLSFDNAWRRIAMAFLTGKDAEIQKLAQKEIKQNTILSHKDSVSYGSIEISTPKDRGFIVVDIFPAPIAVNWEVIAKKEHDDAYFLIKWWPAASEAVAKSMRVRGREAILSIEKAGRYFVEVSVEAERISPKSIVLDIFRTEEADDYMR